MFGDEIERLMTLHPITGEVVSEDEELGLPGHALRRRPERMERAIHGIEAGAGRSAGRAGAAGQAARGAAAEDAHHLRHRDDAPGRLLLGHRELLAAHRRPRAGDAAPHTLLDYFPEDFLLVIDESHVTVPQIGGMYEGDMSRKRDAGRPRLPAAERDGQPAAALGGVPRANRPDASTSRRPPARTSCAKADGVVEQIIRPTGLVDPEVVVKPTKGQIDDLVHEIRQRAERDERVLVTTLTKKMAEDLTDYLLELGIRVRYLHCEVDTLRRVELLRELAARRVRRARRHQPAARGPRPARGVAGVHPRCRQGGLPALRHVAHPDDRPRRPQRLGSGPHVRRLGDAVDAERHR